MIASDKAFLLVFLTTADKEKILIYPIEIALEL